MAILLAYSTSGITFGKKFITTSKWRLFWKFLNIQYSFVLIADIWRRSQIMQKTTFIVMTSSMTSQGTLYRIWRPYWMAVKLEVGIWLQKNKPHSKLCQLQLFLRWWRHDYVMLGLWKFSNFCSRHTVGVAGDAIMYHILVITRDSEGDNIFVLCVCLCVCVFVRMI